MAITHTIDKAKNVTATSETQLQHKQVKVIDIQ